MMIDTDRLIEAVERSMFDLSSPGFCRACGAEVDGVEPDAAGYTCEECGKPEVYGAEQLLLMGVGA